MKRPEGEEREDPRASVTVARRGRNSGRPESEVRSVPPQSGRPQARSSASTPRTTGSGKDSALEEVLRAEEAIRAHGFAGVVFPVCFAVACAMPFLGGDAIARQACTIALVVMGLASAYVFYLTRDASNLTRYSRLMHHSYGWLLFAGWMFLHYYWGLFSPAVVVLALGTHYYGQSSDRRDSFIMPLIVIGTYATTAGLIAAGVLEDRGLFSAAHLDRATLAFATIAVSGMLLVTLRMARVARVALREAIDRSHDAVRVAQRREAQLAEAHHQLDHALRVSVGRPGRYTGAMAGPYALDVVVGIGAIGEVYAATHQVDGSRAAVKLLQAAASEREDLVERILREGAISAQLDSPYVVRVFGAGRMEDGAPYVAMELLQGHDLATRLRQDGQLALDELERLAEHLGAGLHHAHQAQVIHRDLKPLNIFGAEERGRTCWKILDFGISKLSSSTGTLTQEGVLGTPGYMSPEQARGAELSLRSDLFSMAVVLYRAMTGQPAFPGDGTPQIMFDIVYKVPKRPGAVTKGLPSDLDLVMAIALAKDPELRFQSAPEFATAFVQACRRQLPDELRARGALMTRAYPWGKALVSASERPLSPIPEAP